MLNAIWFGMIVLSVVCAMCTGHMGDLSQAVLDGSQQAVELCLFLMGSMCAWLGFLKVAEKSGLTELLASALAPLMDRLFPEYRNEPEIKGKMCMNISANFLGLGNAATPLGLAAVSAMKEKNQGKAPTGGMILFVVLNTASIQLLPVNMAAMRSSCGSTEPFGILPEVWLTSAASLLVPVIFCKLMERADGAGKKGKGIPYG